MNEYRIILPNKEIRWIRATGHTTYLNNEMHQIFGIDKNSFKGLLRNVIKSVIHPDDLHVVLPENAAEFAKNEINEYRIIQPDHSIRHIQAKAGQTKFDAEGKFEPNVSYTLKQTPCDDVVGKAICCFPENVCQLFPRDETLQDLKAHSYIGTTLWSFAGKPIGLIAIIGQKPLKNTAFAENVLKLVAIRAAGELERKNLEKIREIQYNIATAVVTSDNVEQLLEFVGTQLSQIVDTTNFFAALYNAKNNRLKKLHWVDEVDDFEEWDAAKSFSGYVVKTGKTLLLNKPEIAKLGAEQNIPIIGEPAECWLGVPRANALKFPIFGLALLLEFLKEMGVRGTPINRA